MEDIIDIIVTETTNLIEITSQPTDEIIDVNIIDNREDVTLNVTPTLVEININSLTGNFGVNWGEIEGTLSNQTDLQTVLNAKADLVDGKVPSSQLPSYVDDVVEVANYAALPVTGEVGKIYITLDTNYIYRWTGSTYVEIKDSSAVWGAITGTLSNQTDLQNALNAKANDNAVVHLAGTETITGAKTFSSAVIAPNFVLSGGTGNTGLYYGHTDRVVLANYTTGGIDFEVNGGSIVATLFPSGNYGLGITLDAGYKLDVNGTTRISGALSGTSASFSSSVTASSIIKSGGTSSQFLKADGSLDSSTYLTTGTAASTYLPLTGGTLTGGLNGTFGNFSSYVNAQTIDISNSTASNALRITHTNGSYHAVSIVATGNSALYASGNVTVVGAITSTGVISAQSGLANGIGQSFALPTTSGTLALTSQLSSYLPLTGGTLTGALSGTSATFSGDISAGSVSGTSGYRLKVEGLARFEGANTVLNYGELDTNNVYFQALNTASNASKGFVFYGTGEYMRIASTGAATFSSSVTAANFYVPSSNEIRFYNTNSTNWGTIKGSTDATNGYITLTGGSGNGMIIANSGNVGIGTTSPSYLLDIVKNGVNNIRVQNTLNNSDAYYVAQNTGGSAFFGINDVGPYIYTGAALALQLYTNGSERMRITSSGNVGIGLTNPQTQFHINGVMTFSEAGFDTVRLHKIVHGHSDGNSNNNYIAFQVSDGSGTTAERMRINGNGSACFGRTTSPSSSYTAAFQEAVAMYINTNGNNMINWFNASGTYVSSIVINSSTVMYNTVSDYRLKEDLKSFKGLDLVSKINVYDYKWKSDGTRMYGVVAHELQEVLPDAVSGLKDAVNPDGSIKNQGVDYSKIVPVMVQAIKDLKAELDTLKNK